MYIRRNFYYSATTFIKHYKELKMVWFIDKEGKKWSSKSISSHVGLALFIMEKYPEYEEEFKRSHEQDPSNFFLKEKEWMMGSDIKRLIIFNRDTLTDKQRTWLQYYIAEERYKKDDTFDISDEEEIKE